MDHTENLAAVSAYQEDNAYLKRALDREAQFIDTLKEQVRNLRLDCERLSNQAQQEANAAAQKEQALTDMASLAEERAKAIRDQQAQITDLRSSLSQTQMELEAVRGQVQCYETSTIWRMTAPLRKLLDFLKGM